MSVPQHLRAPQEDGAVVAEPALEQIGTVLADNRRRLARASGDLLGRSWQDLRCQARRAALAAAQDYLQRAREPVPAYRETSLLLSGHQPELFHPGVWVKNYALQGLARRHGVTPVNLVVDNDTVKATALHVPAMIVPPPPLDQFHPTLLSIPFDRGTYETPYEERKVQDEELFASLPLRAQQQWGYTPLLPAFWEEVLRQAERTPLLGERFAAARRTFERRWGCHNLEVSVSALCQTEPFAWFACHLLAELPRFHHLYNSIVHAYREEHGIRSRNHPVPDLGLAGTWLESPFWAWRTGQRQRGRLFVRRTENVLELRVGEETWPTLPVQALAPAWLQLEQDGFKVRSRALTNTLYARLFLADLFIHGIGGGKYDELTDELMRRFYGFEPPGYMVLSATLLLPLPRYPAGADDCRGLGWQLRDVHHNPQRHLSDVAGLDAHAAQLVEEKRHWIEQPCSTRQQRRERFRRLRQLTEQLRVHLREREKDLRRQWETCVQHVQANALLRRRDYSFCLYPEAELRTFCTHFL